MLWFDDEATGAVVLELRGTDRIGLLHRVAAALEGGDADLRWARVATLGASVVDSFGLADRPGVGTRRRGERCRRAVAAPRAPGGDVELTRARRWPRSQIGNIP